ncbi:hypothetical protein DB347_06665 [Opitutaceae bacterium EW11]|nr:hypothetical protein DB347_06665 [Opitutaceae bacterium EW11]
MNNRDGCLGASVRAPASARKPRALRSVFTKLVAIMVAMAAGLLLLVAGFFAFIVGPNLHSSIDELLRDYTRHLAATAPDLATAKERAARVNLHVRYEGPAGAWSTAPDMPTIDEIRRGAVAQRSAVLLNRNYYLVPGPDGGTYLFGWSLGNRMNQIHTALVALLLGVMIAVIVITYFTLRQLLQPLKRLNEGVDRLSAGELDVVVAESTHDEFGRLTEAFNRMVGRVQGMIAARDQLLLDVSHELRSPLTRMKVALELMPANPRRDGMAADVTEMERMIAELLELERLRSGRGLEIVRQDLMPILRDVVATFESTAPGVRIVAAKTEIFAAIDAEKVRTVFRNLLENAAKYARPESRPVEISVRQEDNTAVIRVTDDGPGIPESEIESVFEPFFRVDRSRSKNTGGYGLGLSICKRIMQAHGGDISLERNRRSGASFILTFPLEGAPGAP